MSTEPGLPLALDRAALDRIGGVLGEICLQRASDYAAAKSTARQMATGGDALAGLRGPGLRVIAEVKRASPRGALADLDAPAAARSYAAAGAGMISVLTEPRRFRGSLADLEAVRRAVALPVLRKDFMVHEAMLDEAVEAGASVVLLIVAALGEATGAFLEAASSRNLTSLVEVHDEAELDLALRLNPAFLGVNNRDLRTLDLDLGASERLGQLARSRGYRGVLAALSGYGAASDLGALGGVFNAILVGSSLSVSGDGEGAARRLVERAAAVPAWGAP
ncbi:MAG TPA: indole-3-glycerol phosphate synthase TrpC [Deinococcales bacterium]|nr:indole-3-glycerol phosphate synthase TrpC [Deinococcales bacterium]